MKDEVGRVIPYREESVEITADSLAFSLDIKVIKLVIIQLPNLMST